LIAGEVYLLAAQADKPDKVVVPANRQNHRAVLNYLDFADPNSFRVDHSLQSTGSHLEASGAA
jgi:hypothetical protein